MNYSCSEQDPPANSPACFTCNLSPRKCVKCCQGLPYVTNIPGTAFQTFLKGGSLMLHWLLISLKRGVGRSCGVQHSICEWIPSERKNHSLSVYMMRMLSVYSSSRTFVFFCNTMSTNFICSQFNTSLHCILLYIHVNQ